jgi:hypothetical protein
MDMTTGQTHAHFAVLQQRLMQLLADIRAHFTPFSPP